MNHRPTARHRIAALTIAVAACATAGCAGEDEASDATVATTPATAVDTAAPTDTTPVTEPSVDATTPATTDLDDPALDALADETIVALDENAAFSLLSLGVEPDLVLTSLDSETFASVAQAQGIATEDFLIAEPNLERLAALGADRFVGLANPFVVERAADYEAIASLIAIPVTGTWQDQVTSLADALGLTTADDALIAAVDGEEARVAALVDEEGVAGSTLSVLSARVGTIIAANADGASGSIAAAVGLARPAAQGSTDGGLPFTPVAGEQLAEHDADELLLASGAVFDLTPITTSPLYAGLGAVSRGDVAEVVGELWLVGGSPFAAWWVLQDLAAVITDDEVGTIADANDRWAAFLDLVAAD